MVPDKELRKGNNMALLISVVIVLGLLLLYLLT